MHLRKHVCQNPRILKKSKTQAEKTMFEEEIQNAQVSSNVGKKLENNGQQHSSKVKTRKKSTNINSDPSSFFKRKCQTNVK